MSASTSDQRADQSTQNLLSQANTGDPDAWRELYERYRIHLLLAIRGKLPQVHGLSFDPEDVLQSAFLSAWSRIRTFEYRGEGSFRRWLAQIVANNAIGKLRKQIAERKNLPADPRAYHPVDLLPDETARRPSELVSGVEEEERLLVYLESLPEDLREILVMREFERKRWDEIATLLDLANSTVRLKYREGWTRLAQRMGAEA